MPGVELQRERAADRAWLELLVAQRQRGDWHGTIVLKFEAGNLCYASTKGGRDAEATVIPLRPRGQGTYPPG